MKPEIMLMQQKISDKILAIDAKIRLNEADQKSVCSRNIKLQESMIDYNMHGSPSGDNSVRAARIDNKFKKIRKNRNNMNKRNIKSIRIRNTIIEKQKRYVNRMYNELAKMTGTSNDDKKYKKAEHDGGGIESSSNEQEDKDSVDDEVKMEDIDVVETEDRDKVKTDKGVPCKDNVDDVVQTEDRDKAKTDKPLPHKGAPCGRGPLGGVPCKDSVDDVDKV